MHGGCSLHVAHTTPGVTVTEFQSVSSGVESSWGAHWCLSLGLSRSLHAPTARNMFRALPCRTGRDQPCAGNMPCLMAASATDRLTCWSLCAFKSACSRSPPLLLVDRPDPICTFLPVLDTSATALYSSHGPTARGWTTDCEQIIIPWIWSHVLDLVHPRVTCGVDLRSRARVPSSAWGGTEHSSTLASPLHPRTSIAGGGSRGV